LTVSADDILTDIGPTLPANDSDGDCDAISIGEFTYVGVRLVGTDAAIEDVFPDGMPVSDLRPAHSDGPINFTPADAYQVLPEGMIA